MYYIHINSIDYAKQFINTLKSDNNHIHINNIDNLYEWLIQIEKFPLEFYINGVTLKFNNQEQLNYFILGFETMLNIYDEF